MTKKISIIGLGYAGFPLAVAVAHKQFKGLNKNDYKKISSNSVTIIGIKGIVENPTWRL